jgi:DNA-binding NarL/FixJ family response regulator
MAEGAANKAIAWKLDISEHTVKYQVASILSKLGAGPAPKRRPSACAKAC